MKTYHQFAGAAMLLRRPIGGATHPPICNPICVAGRRRAIHYAPSLIATTALLVGLLLTPVLARADDAVMEWNQIALAATVTAGQGPVPQRRTMAIVQASVHDAVNAITCDYRTYLSIPCGRWGSPEAAAIAAAHRALAGLLPGAAVGRKVARFVVNRALRARPKLRD